MRLSIDELRTLFLFESLTDEQLGWLSREGHVEAVEDGIVFSEGDEATCCYLLLYRWAADVQAARTAKRSRSTAATQRGVYAGAVNAFLGADERKAYTATDVGARSRRRSSSSPPRRWRR